MKAPWIALTLVLWQSALSACSVDDHRPLGQTRATHLSWMRPSSLESPIMEGRWQGETLGESRPDQPCTFDITPVPGTSESQQSVKLSVDSRRHIYTTMSQDNVAEMFSGKPLVVKMQPQNVSDWLDIVTNKLATIAYGKFLAAYEFVVSLTRGDAGAAGTAVVRAAQIEWVVLTAACHFETQWTLQDAGPESGLEIEGVQSLICNLKNAPPTTFSLDNIRCHRLRLRNPNPFN